jgi:hypothetical protein
VAPLIEKEKRSKILKFNEFQDFLSLRKTQKTAIFMDHRKNMRA